MAIVVPYTYDEQQEEAVRTSTSAVVGDGKLRPDATI